MRKHETKKVKLIAASERARSNTNRDGLPVVNPYPCNFAIKHRGIQLDWISIGTVLLHKWTLMVVHARLSVRITIACEVARHRRCNLNFQGSVLKSNFYSKMSIKCIFESKKLYDSPILVNKNLDC